MGRITFNFEEKDKVSQVFEIGVGETVLDVAIDNNINLHHNCGAVCACSTCHIYIDKGDELLPEMSETEEDFVDRARNPKFNSRLACQSRINAEGDIEVTIPDQSTIIGH